MRFEPFTLGVLDDMCCPTLALRTAEEAEHCAAVDAEDALSLSHAWA